MQSNILSVTELTFAIKQHLEARFSAIAVQGEVSNLKEQSSGHLYFTLKDAEAQVSCVLFKGNTRGLSRMPKNGDRIVIKGELTVYPPKGNYQIVVRQLTYSGVGELLLKLHEMKVKLQERGWFDKARKKSLPKYPKTIGVVTSATGSVIQDILHILTRRLSGFHLILNPVKVQGENAAQEIAAAIDQFNKYQLADVLIVGRGGGSLEDLWAFNEEEVARALFHSKIPVVSAVGHETDYCIADFVADARAPTPSAAAEIITTEKARELQFLSQLKSRMHTTVQIQVAHARKQCEHFKRRIPSSTALFTPHMQRIDDLSSDLAEASKRLVKEKRAKILLLAKEIALQNPQHQLALAKAKLLSFDRSLRNLFKSIAEKREKLQQLIKHLKGIDPKNLLAKGFCIAFDADVLIPSAHEMRTKETVRLLMHDGNVHLTVNK